MGDHFEYERQQQEQSEAESAISPQLVWCKMEAFGLLGRDFNRRMGAAANYWRSALHNLRG